MKPGAYRPDVDGLRAVAVVLVILNHFQAALAPNGYIGVDLFFVISGFVVTGAYLKTGQGLSAVARLTRFWKRRLFRILPANVSIIAATLAAAGLVTLPFPREVYNATVRTGIAGLVGLANAYLYRGSTDYFASDTSTNPFVHLWSLAVEEQFYLLFALAVIGLGGDPANGRRRRTIVTVMGLVGAASFLLFRSNESGNPIAAYYLIENRLWELAIGCILAYVLPALYPNVTFRTLQRPLAASCLQLLTVAILIVTVWIIPSSGLPGGPITLATLSAAMFILAGAYGEGVVHRMLSTRPVVAIGKASYSLYLWHYPVLAIARITIGIHNPAAIAVSAAAIAALSVITYRFVEQPFRTPSPQFRLRRGWILGAMAAVAMSLGFVVSHWPGVLYAGRDVRWETDWLLPQDAPYSRSGAITQRNCNLTSGPTPGAIPANCIAAPAHQAARTLLLVGDSHAFADWGMAVAGADSGAYNFITMARDGCNIAQDPDSWQPSCRQYWEGLPTLVRNTLRPGDTLFVSIFWSMASAPRQRTVERLRSLRAAFVDGMGGNMIVEAPLPVFDRPAFTCDPQWFRTDYSGCSVGRDTVEQWRHGAMDDLRSLAQTGNGLRVWDPLPLLCRGVTCRSVVDGNPVFRDRNHISVLAARSLADPFLAFWRTSPAAR